MEDGERGAHANPNLALCLHFLLRMVPFAVAGLTLYLGYDLYLRGVTGHASLAGDSTTLQGQVINAVPGLLLGVGGFVVLVVAIIKGADSGGLGTRL